MIPPQRGRGHPRKNSAYIELFKCPNANKEWNSKTPQARKRVSHLRAVMIESQRHLKRQLCRSWGVSNIAPFELLNTLEGEIHRGGITLETNRKLQKILQDSMTKQVGGAQERRRIAEQRRREIMAKPTAHEIAVKVANGTFSARNGATRLHRMLSKEEFPDLPSERLLREWLSK